MPFINQNSNFLQKLSFFGGGLFTLSDPINRLISKFLLANFSVLDQSFILAQVLGKTEGVEVGGLRVTGVPASIISGALSLPPGGEVEDVNVYPASVGRIFRVDGVGQGLFDLSGVFQVDPLAVFDFDFPSNAIYNGRSRPANKNIDSLAFLIGGYNGVDNPFDPSLSFALFKDGLKIFVRSLSTQGWSLFHVEDFPSLSTVSSIISTIGSSTTLVESTQVTKDIFPALHNAAWMDTFDGPDGTLIENHAPNVGNGSYSQITPGAIAISGGFLFDTTGDNSNFVEYNTGLSDFHLIVTIPNDYDFSVSSLNINFRVGGMIGWIVGITTFAIFLIELTLTSSPIRGLSFFSSFRKLYIRAEGEFISIFMDGIEVISYPLAFGNIMAKGMQFGNFNTNRIQSLEVYPMQSGLIGDTLSGVIAPVSNPINLGSGI